MVDQSAAMLLSISDGLLSGIAASVWQPGVSYGPLVRRGVGPRGCLALEVHGFTMPILVIGE